MTDEMFRIVKEKVLLIVLLLVLAGFAMEGWGKNLGKRWPLTVRTADKLEYSGQTFTASGNVEVSWKDYRIYADYLEFNRETKELQARGRVTMASGQTVVSGERFRFNIKEKRGELYETYGQLSPTTRYTSDHLTQVDPQTLEFKKFDFTPCAQCVPRWKISCANGKIKKEKYIEMKHVLFKIKNVPVFYVPYMRYPIDKDGRATGFLLPLAGKSSVGGSYLLNAFYWNIKPTMDLTLNFDWYDRAGQGIAEEFRYLSRKMDGTIKFYFFNYRKDFNLGSLFPTGSGGGDEGEMTLIPRKFDYFFKMKHKQQIPLPGTKTRLTVDIDKQSDPNFMRIFGSNFESAANRLSRSSVALTSSLSNKKLSVSASRNDTFNTVLNRTVSNRYQPTVKFNLNQEKFGRLPGHFSLEISHSTIGKVTRNHSVEADPVEADPVPEIWSGRLNLTPSYTLNLLKIPWFTATLRLRSVHNFYNRSRDLAAEKVDDSDSIIVIDEPVNFDYQTAEFSVKGPVFSRIFESKRAKLKHLIEPKLTFRYAVTAADDVLGRTVVLDSLDRASASYSYVSASLGTRLLFKRKPNTSSTGKKGTFSAREIVSYTIK
ncbi:MAG: LPS-assembly protein LptD, partial [bacterium]|nr:LPS-assembly protein LptD [bacterium]